MRILLDQGTPVPLRKHLSAHFVATAFELGWATLKNGELLRQAEAANYELLITTDQNLRYQQNLIGHKISVLVLSTTSWPRIERAITEVTETIADIQLSSYVELAIP